MADIKSLLMEDSDGSEEGLLRASSPMKDFEILDHDPPRATSPIIDLTDEIENDLPLARSTMVEFDGIEVDSPLAESAMGIDDAEPAEMQVDATTSYVPPEPIHVREEPMEERVSRGGRKMTLKEEEDARWAVAKLFFDHRSLVENQLNSFNEFVEKKMQEMFTESIFFPIDVPPDHNPASFRVGGYPRQAKISFGAVTVGKPDTYVDDEKKETRALFPKEARLRNMTYAAPINLEITLQVILYSCLIPAKTP